MHGPMGSMLLKLLDQITAFILLALHTTRAYNVDPSTCEESQPAISWISTRLVTMLAWYMNSYASLRS